MIHPETNDCHSSGFASNTRKCSRKRRERSPFGTRQRNILEITRILRFKSSDYQERRYSLWFCTWRLSFRCEYHDTVFCFDGPTSPHEPSSRISRACEVSAACLSKQVFPKQIYNASTILDLWWFMVIWCCWVELSWDVVLGTPEKSRSVSDARVISASLNPPPQTFGRKADFKMHPSSLRKELQFRCSISMDFLPISSILSWSILPLKMALRCMVMFCRTKGQAFPRLPVYQFN